MKAKRMLSLLLTAALMLSMMTPVLAASAETELPRASQTRLEETNEVVSIRLQAAGKLVYGSPFELSVVTRPADVQYIGVVLGVKGEAKGYVTLVLSDKLRTLLKMIPLPRKMSKTPDQVEEFNVYAYVKQLIDGNDIGVLLSVADEVVKVMDALKFYIPTLKDMSLGLKLSLEMIRARTSLRGTDALSDCGGTGLAGTHAGHGVKRSDPHLAVSDGAGASGLNDHTDQRLGVGVIGQHLNANLRNQIHGVFGATVDLSVTALTAVAVSLGHGQTVHTGGREGLLDVIELMRLNDSGDQLHFTSPP